MRATILPVLLLLAACDRQSTPQPQGEAAKGEAPAAAAYGKADYANKGKAPPADAFMAPDGSKTTLAAFKGRPLLVNLWATWCAPCLKELPSLDTLAGREKDKVQVVVISQDMKGDRDIQRWWDQQGYANLKTHFDANADLSFAYGGGTLPMTILYDAQGKEVWRVVGDLDWAGDAARALIAEANPA